MKKKSEEANTYANMIRTDNNIWSICYHNKIKTKKKVSVKTSIHKYIYIESITSNHIEIFQYEVSSL
ncbi:hypothetical protein PFDG_05323 [Plasmodium falciparum Dd2]|uniref:Uncharacterized protein n=1 Tax=Plasmodium falciparum (isolate Dd2) TaxID=57267 RepID=A0A0L7MB03_PLAF4|nr:hypothetical protein PFDG_05323 [Plasmodium falciparum Dd2]